MREMGVTVAKEGVDTYSFKAENVDLAYLVNYPKEQVE